MTTNTHIAARTFHELTEDERVNAVAAFKSAHGSMAELNFAPDRAWIEGFAYAQALEAAEQDKPDLTLVYMAGVHAGRKAAEAAPALDAQGERSGFPHRIMKLLLEVAEREGKGSRGPWEDGDGEPLQEDADAAISWIDHMASAPPPPAVGKPLSDEQIRSMCAQSWVFETVKQWVRIVETHHGIVTRDSGT